MVGETSKLDVAEIGMPLYTHVIGKSIYINKNLTLRLTSSLNFINSINDLNIISNIRF